MVPLTPDLIIAAYCHGIFPMAEKRRGEVRWFEPYERGILEFENLKISRSLAKVVRSGHFAIRFDSDFERVIQLCATVRDETWISGDIETAFVELHEHGFAHSVEAWNGDKLVGGLYGVAINGAFFGESMFHTETNASKVALVHLVRHLVDRGFSLLDTQYPNPHLESLGGSTISREEYQVRRQQALSSNASFDDRSPGVNPGFLAGMTVSYEVREEEGDEAE